MVFSAKLRGELAEITEAGLGVREVIERHRDEVSRVEIDNPMIRLDLNTPDDYREAMARYAR